MFKKKLMHPDYNITRTALNFPAIKYRTAQYAITKRHSPTEPTLNRRGSTVIRFVGYSTGIGPQIASSNIWNKPPAANQKMNRRIMDKIPACHNCIPVAVSASGVQKKASAATYRTNQWEQERWADCQNKPSDLSGNRLPSMALPAMNTLCVATYSVAKVTMLCDTPVTVYFLSVAFP